MTTVFRREMQDNLSLLLQWREIDQNGYLATHVGQATNIFGVQRDDDVSDDGSAGDHDGVAP